MSSSALSSNEAKGKRKKELLDNFWENVRKTIEKREPMAKKDILYSDNDNGGRYPIKRITKIMKMYNDFSFCPNLMVGKEANYMMREACEIIAAELTMLGFVETEYAHRLKVSEKDIQEGAEEELHLDFLMDVLKPQASDSDPNAKQKQIVSTIEMQMYNLYRRRKKAEEEKRRENLK